MADELLWYYERELGYLRRLGAEFAQRYPKVAGRLQLEPTKCEDPHVERLLEGFAFLASRIHLQLDNDMGEVAGGLLGLVAPHFVRPVPASSIAEFRLDPERAKQPAGVVVPRGAALQARPVGGVQCAFRTTFDLRLWPVTVADARWVAPDALQPPVRASDAVGALRIELHGFPDVPLGSLTLDTLRLYLHADGSLAATLYEVLCNACTGVIVRPLDPAARRAGTAAELPASALRPAGFDDEERLLPGGASTFTAYGLLQEYFVLPEKYRFVDLAIGDALRALNAGGAVEVICLVGPFERPERRHALAGGVGPSVVRVGCTPVVNLFAQTAEPILLTHRRDEYPLVADARRRLTTEIYSVDEVVAVAGGGGDPMPFEPLYGLRHDVEPGTPQVYWNARRRLIPGRTDGSTEVTLAFIDRDARTMQPEFDAVTARVTCFNGDLPARLPIGDPRGDFELIGGGPFTQIAALVKPTEPVHPPLGKPLLWRLVSQLSLNHLSLTDGPDALRELLRLYDLRGAPETDRQIQGIVGISSRPAHARVSSASSVGLARGRRVELDLDEDNFAGDGAFLFASVLERFFALYASMNSFTQLTVRTRQRRRPLREWAPRAGERVLL